MTSQPHADPVPQEPGAIRRLLGLFAHPASAGLVAVLLVLTAFSVGAAAMNAAAAAEAELSVEVSELADAAQQSLELQEELVDELVAEDDAEARAEYRDAVAVTRNALREIGTAAYADDAQWPDRWLALHSDYEAAVVDLLAVASITPDLAEEFEDEHVDVRYDAVEEVVKSEVREHRSAADAALADLRGAHQLLLWVTPAVFGIGLALVAWCTAILDRSRREIAARAEENRQQALHDALTGLPNRTLLRQQAAAALSGTDGSATVALMLIDLDRFKEINDTLGHAYGDIVLQVVADRLRGSVRATDTVARLGGDEFAILLPLVDGPDAAFDLAVRAREALEAGIVAEGVTVDVDASIGIALAGPGAGAGGVEALLRRADIAMYSAKDRGVGVCVFDAGLDDHDPERLGLLGELRRAIDAGELVLHYQPKVTVAGGDVCGVEALVRWEHPERGLIPPGTFIPLVERTPLVHALTRYVIDSALAQCASWQAEGRSLQVAVNISARNLLDDGFVHDVLELLDRHGVPAAFLELEVTESAIMADPARARMILGQLAAAGITLSIDDFGAGYTSLAHLKDLPVHQLKIDRSFVASMMTDHSDALIVHAVVELGHSLGLTTVAEGVEDEATWQRLRTVGCDLAQGYHLSRPMPAQQLEAWYGTTRGVVPA